MRDWSTAREGWDRDVRVTNGRARWAIGALLAMLAARVFEMTVNAAPSLLGAEMYSSLGAWGRSAEIVTLLATIVLFLRWLFRVVNLTHALRVTPLAWTASQAMWGFFIPILSLFRPYQVLRDLHDQLAPDGVPEPAPRPRLDGSGGYRTVAMETAPPPRPLPHAFIGAFWGLFVADRLLNFVPFVGETLAVGATALAVLVVRGIEGRLEERYRRVRHASDDELEVWGIDA